MASAATTTTGSSSSSSTEQRGQGKRWCTTTRSALEFVTSKLDEVPSREMVVKDLKDRKTRNTTTSICFGTDQVLYESDAMSRQHDCLNGMTPREREAIKMRNKQMKADLTRTNFRLGDEKPTYVVTSLLPYPENPEEGRGKLSVETAESIKRSSLHFGTGDKPNYQSVAHEGMRYRGNDVDFTARTAEVKAMKVGLTRHNFSFGEERPLYQSVYKAGFHPHNLSDAATRDHAALKKQIEDIRRSHFVLGNEKVDYVSHQHEQMCGAEVMSPAEIQAQLEKNRKLKQYLQRTNFVIGDDPEYT